MRRTLFLPLWFLVPLFLLWGGGARAETVNLNASGEIQVGLSMTELTPIDFGAFIPEPVPITRWEINLQPNGTVTLIDIVSHFGGQVAGAITLTGQPGSSLTITAPTTVAATGPSVGVIVREGSVSFNGGAACNLPCTTGIGPLTGSDVLSVGFKMDGPGGELPGTYSAVIPITGAVQ